MDTTRDDKGRFIKGRVIDDETELKRLVHFEESWKKRENYIGDIKEENPRIYNTWRAIRFTNKGKKVGNCPEWNDFRTFYNDVSPTYKKGLVFRRLNLEDNFNPNNFIWVTKEEAEMLRSNLIWLEIDGERLTLKQVANKYGVALGGLKIRYHKRKERNYTLDEIIFGRNKNRGSKKIRDYKISSVTPRQKASKMISSYRNKDLHQTPNSICDIDIDWMIENIFRQPCVYCGDTERIGCDRLDNTKGHTKDNVVPCCYDCNCARNQNFTFEEMLVIGKAVAKVKKARKKKNKTT